MRENYFDFLRRIYKYDYDFIPEIRNITLQVTDDCCCNCSYCYQKKKSHNYMTKEIGKAIIDCLFNMNNNFLKQDQTIGLVLDFIGGEPLMNIDVIDYICSYYLDQCLRKNQLWAQNSRFSMISNGAKYFQPKVQEFLNKFDGLVSFDITLDGPKEIHDLCRKYHNGQGNFADAYAAFKDCQKKFGNTTTKVTIAPENLNQINTIIDFFINEGITDIYANPIFEHNWTIQEAQIYYQQLKIIADKILIKNDLKIYCSLFSEFIGHSLPTTELNTWCGGTGQMLAFDSFGIAYPCIRYMESSLNNDQPPIILGDCFNGICNSIETQNIYNNLINIDRKTQSTEECFNCDIASGCAYCSGWNYQLNGTANSRCTYICNMHYARVLANVYYWNQYYKKQKINKKFKLNMSDQKALQFISQEELNMLHSLEK